jgi:hypothetical protein
MSDQDALTREIDENLEFFQSKLGELLKGHRNRYALLRHRQIIGMYDTLRDAKMAGDKLYTDGIFSIQEVSDSATNLGVYSYAMHMGAAQ